MSIFLEHLVDVFLNAPHKAAEFEKDSQSDIKILDNFFFSKTLLNNFQELKMRLHSRLKYLKRMTHLCEFTYEDNIVDQFKLNLLLMIFWFYIINYNS